MLKKYNRTIFFYGLSLIIPWILWFLVAYFSHMENKSSLIMFLMPVLGVLGLVSPVFVAGYLFLIDKDLMEDLKNRIFNMQNFNFLYFVITFLLIPLSIVIAQLISVFFGHSLSQFYISGNPSFTSFFFHHGLYLFLLQSLKN